MFLQQKLNHEMLEVLSLNELFDPFNETLIGRYQHGEEVQGPENLKKQIYNFYLASNYPSAG